MKFTKLSLIAAVAVSSAFAGGDIEPVVAAPVVEEVLSNTTIAGKLTGYYITTDSSSAYDMFDKDWSQLGLAATLDVTHKFTDNIAMNFSAIGYLNTNRDIPFNYISNGYFESNDNGAYINVANITATFMDTTFILGRQLLDTPMLGSFDWLLAPGAFEAYTVANNSIENLTLVGSYVRTWRPNNSGDNFINLTDIDDGNNWTLGAAYDNKTINASVWYYNVDAGGVITDNTTNPVTTLNPSKYTQVYADAGYNFGVAKIAAQYANTNYDTAIDSDVFGVKASATLGSFNLMAAYENVSDNIVGFVGRDTLYTSSWNTFTSKVVGDSFKVEAGSEFAGVTASISYAYYEYETLSGVANNKDGSEVDVILGYSFNDSIDLNVVYTNTKADFTNFDDVNALEIYANYKF